MKIKDVIDSYEEWLEMSIDKLYDAKVEIVIYKQALRKLKKLDPESIYME